MNLGWMLLMCGLLIAPPPKPIKVPGIGKPPKSDDLAVDVVQIGSGPKLLGAVLHQSPRGDLVVAVERSWLERAYPEFYKKQSVREVQEAREAWRELKQRLGEWRKRRAGEDRLRSFIEMEQARVDKNLARLEPELARLDDQFMIIDVGARQFELKLLKPADRRQIAMLAWREQLPDVATRSVSSLSKELADLGFSVADERVNLFDRLPIRRQSDKEWQARRALLEYVERQSLDYQGTTDLLVGTGAGQEPPDLGAVISQVAQSQLTSTLGELLGGTGALGGTQGKPKGVASAKGLEKSRQEAADKKIEGFRATMLTLEVERRRAVVDGLFSARLDGGRWVTVWKDQEAQAAGKIDPAQRDRIRNDPQVKQALDLLKASGLAADDTIEIALGVGGATMTAQERLNERFSLFLGAYRHHADGPPLFLPEGD